MYKILILLFLFFCSCEDTTQCVVEYKTPKGYKHVEVHMKCNIWYKPGDSIMTNKGQKLIVVSLNCK